MPTNAPPGGAPGNKSKTAALYGRIRKESRSSQQVTFDIRGGLLPESAWASRADHGAQRRYGGADHAADELESRGEVIPGDRLGSYEITGAIGAGGWATVAKQDRVTFIFNFFHELKRIAPPSKK